MGEPRNRGGPRTGGDDSGTEPILENCIDAACCDIVAKLLDALGRERLLDPPLSAAERAGLAKLDPDAILLELAERGRFTVPTPNLRRAMEEIDDAVVGLARARAGLEARWRDAAAVAPASEGAFTALVEECLRRCPADDAGPSALLARFEQLVGEGHPAHPCAKTCLGLGPGFRDVLPEQVERVALRFAAVAPALVEATGCPVPEALDGRLPIVASALRSELEALGLADHCVIPVHPWQWDNVVRDEFSAEIASGQVVLLETVVPAEPLMSVRTVRITDGAGAVHVKLALEAQLTGAVRGVSKGALAGPLVSAALSGVLAADEGTLPRDAAGMPAFRTAEDLAGVRFRESEGRRAHCFGAVVRADPVADAEPGDVPMPIAALQAPNPLTGRPILLDLLDEVHRRSGDGRTTMEDTVAMWFGLLAELLVVPSVSLLARWGVALEPHPQNAVLVLRDGLPHHVVVRDYGGVRIHRHSRFAASPANARVMGALAGTALPADAMDAVVDKLSYPLLVNTVCGLARTVAEAGVPEDVARRPVARRLRGGLRRLVAVRRTSQAMYGMHDIALIRAKLTREPLPLKRVMGMRLTGAVTEQDYVRVANPFAAAGPDVPLDGAERIVRARLADAARAEGIAAERLRTLEPDVADAVRNLASAQSTVEARAAELRMRSRARGKAGTHWDLVSEVPRALASPFADSLVVAGHNVHPLSKLRRGFTADDSSDFGPENAPVVELRLVAVSDHLVRHSGARGVEGELRRSHPREIADAEAEAWSLAPHLKGSSTIIPVHPWQYDNVVTAEFGEEIRSRLIVPAPTATLPVRPTASLRTSVPVTPGADGRSPMIKTALDVRLTSTRRSISADSALGTPDVAKLVDELVKTTTTGWERPVAVVPEIAGCAYAGERRSPAARRGLSCLIREDPLLYAADDEVVIGANALRGVPEGVESPLQGLAADDPREFLRRYAHDLFGVTLPLLWRYGVALESHLQNAMVRVAVHGGRGHYRGLVLRDFSGLRLHPGRLAAAGHPIPAREGAVTVTADVVELRRKAHYASVFGNIAGIVDELDRIGAQARGCSWELVRAEIDSIIAEHWGRIPDGDVESLLGGTLDQKAFVSMALDERGGDRHVAVPNPLVVPGSPRAGGHPTARER